MTVLAFADYWPSLDPYAEAGDGSYMDFAVMNFDYVNVQTNMEPYQVWIDLEDDASVLLSASINVPSTDEPGESA